MKDRTGRDLEVAQVVELFAQGMLEAVVVRVENGGLIGPDGRQQPAILIVQVDIPFELNPGDLAPVFITKQADMRRLGGPAEKSKKGKLN